MALVVDEKIRRRRFAAEAFLQIREAEFATFRISDEFAIEDEIKYRAQVDHHPSRTTRPSRAPATRRRIPWRIHGLLEFSSAARA